MKSKICEVQLVSECITELTNWINEIENTFEMVQKFNFRECFFESENKKDFRINIQFQSSESKNEIYQKMNLIKANPIKFLK